MVFFRRNQIILREAVATAVSPSLASGERPMAQFFPWKVGVICMCMFTWIGPCLCSGYVATCLYLRLGFCCSIFAWVEPCLSSGYVATCSCGVSMFVLGLICIDRNIM